MSRRGLQLALTVIGAVAVVFGGLGVARGAAGVLEGGKVSANVDSELRFFASWYAVLGALLLRAARRPETDGAIVRAFAATPAGAVGTLDQSQESIEDCGQLSLFHGFGQTFTAGITGDLDQVDGGIAKLSGNDPLTVKIQTVSGGLPGNTVLASTTVPAASIPPDPDFVAVPIGPVPVTAGTQYAIVFAFVDETLNEDFVCFAGGDPYPGGQFAESIVADWFKHGDDDLAFRTYVTPPPPPPPPACKVIRLSLALFGTPIVICL